jgi:DNA-binding transcriptional LysR family regulator
MDKLRALRFFCRVAETSSFAAAAYELDVVPSVLSKVIAALEADVHFKLFNRNDATRVFDRARHALLRPL